MYSETTLGKPISHYALPYSKFEDLYVFLINRFEIDLSGSPRLENIGKAICLIRFVFVHLCFVQSSPFIDLICIDSDFWSAPLSLGCPVGLITRLGSSNISPTAAWTLCLFAIRSAADFVCYLSILGYYESYVFSCHLIWYRLF